MNKDNALEYLPALQALADNELEHFHNLEWVKTDTITWHKAPSLYRRKPKLTVIPWTKETCPVGSVIKVKETGSRYLIQAAVDNHVLVREAYFTYDWTFAECTMDDGSPCGTVVNTAPKMEKPPLGLRPEVAWWNARVREINEAVDRYEDAGVAVPAIWLMERSALESRISLSVP